MAHDLDEQVSSVAALADPVRRALYRYIAASAEPVGRDEAAAAVGVQRALAAFHLDKLAEKGLLDVEFRRLTGRSGPGAGRPSKLYRRTDRQIDVTLPPREYDLAARLLAAAIQRGGDVRAALTVVARDHGRRIGEAVERRAGERPTKTARRAALVEVLREHGFEPRIVGTGVVLANCPFHALADEFTDLVCGMNVQLMQGVRSAVGFRTGELEPLLDPVPGRCCVRFRDSKQSRD